MRVREGVVVVVVVVVVRVFFLSGGGGGSEVGWMCRRQLSLWVGYEV